MSLNSEFLAYVQPNEYNSRKETKYNSYAPEYRRHPQKARVSSSDSKTYETEAKTQHTKKTTKHSKAKPPRRL